MKGYNILFSTNLNETIIMTIEALNGKQAIKKMLKEFPKNKHGVHNIKIYEFNNKFDF